MPDLDREIFDAANAEPVEQPNTGAVEPPQEQPAEAGEPPAGQVRDPATGRFVPKTEAGAQPAANTGAEQPVAQRTAEQPQGDHRVPLAEHLSVRERAQAAERERDETRRQLEAMNRQLEELRRPKPQPPQRPDPWVDPSAFAEHVAREQVAPVQQQQDAMIDRFSRLMAVQTYTKPVVDAAYAELEAAVRSDPLMRLEAQRIWQNEHPYGALVEWHKTQKALKEIGTDPAAYEAKLREKLLADPEFRKAVAAKLQADANGGTSPAANTRPSNVTRLPPSLNRVASAAQNTPPAEGDVDDRELFRLASKG